jgi:glycosyltransferase involved in cell wall biosynthesis
LRPPAVRSIEQPIAGLRCTGFHRMTRRLLMLAFQFPPHDQSTGAQRTLSFVRHLPASDWSPIVITARESAYPQTDPATLKTIPSGTTVLRAFAFDVARTLSLRGIYPQALATPDRWNSWIFGSVAAGLRAVREYQPAAIWATFPIPSAIAAALLLRRLTGLPLIGDLRDPMLYETWPDTRWQRRVYGRLERSLVRAASAIVVTTPGARRLYCERYPEHDEKFHTIANGMEPDDSAAPISATTDTATITLLHSGLMEQPDRDPTAFFAALRLLADQNRLPAQLQVLLRASGKETQYAQAVEAQKLAHVVKILPRTPRAEAMAEMKSATALLLFQGKHCNRQIPAKAYEYLFFGKPIVGLMDPGGDTHALVHRDWGVPYCADMEDPPAIARALEQFFDDHRRNTAYAPPAALRDNHTRRAQAARLADLMDRMLAARGQAAASTQASC